MDGGTTFSVTCAELSTRLGITVPSAKNLCRRKKWERAPGIMQAQKDGAIINISTAWDVEPGAIRRCSRRRKIFADTYAADNVRMNSVLRGWIDNLPAMEERRKSVPMGCYGRADEVAAHQLPRLERHLTPQR